ncbi:IS66 family insertion sequence element accessory protein TnpB, partial [Burkholderia pseudomallei]
SSSSGIVQLKQPRPFSKIEMARRNQAGQFRGKRGDLVKVLWWSGDGMCLLMKRLERGRFVWPRADGGVVCLSQAQLSMLLEGIDWRQPVRTTEPTSAL